MFPVQGVNDVPGLYRGYHSPLEGESQKPSRQAMADAVGGRHGAKVQRGDARGSIGPIRVAGLWAMGHATGWSVASMSQDPAGARLRNQLIRYGL